MLAQQPGADVDGVVTRGARRPHQLGAGREPLGRLQHRPHLV